MSTPSWFSLDTKGGCFASRPDPIAEEAAAAQPPFSTDMKGRVVSRARKGARGFSAPSREVKRGLLGRPLRLDTRVIAAIQKKKSPSSSKELAALDGRIIRAISHVDASFSYPVEEEVVSGTVRDFCRFFFSSFPEARDQEVHSYLMGRVVELTFVSSKVRPNSEFFTEFSTEVVARVQKYVDEEFGRLKKELTRCEWGYGIGSLDRLQKRILLVDRLEKSIYKKLSKPIGSRSLLSSEDLLLVKRALLLNEGEEQREMSLARSLTHCDTPEEELPHIIALGDLYSTRSLREKDPQAAVQAAGLYNYALRLKQEKSCDDLYSKLHQVGQLLFTLSPVKTPGSYLDLDSFCAVFRRNRKGVRSFRERASAIVESLKVDSSPKEVRFACSEISGFMKKVVSILIKQSMRLLGPAPCGYAIVGFGSLAREEATPHSDFEFGILVANENYRPYFQHLSYLLHFFVVNLGETILPCLNIPSLRKAGFFDGRIFRGLSFDGEGGGVDRFGVATKGCKTPFGNRQTFQLIHTPEKMAGFQGKNAKGEYWIDAEPQLPAELLAHTLILGDETLIARYQKALDVQLERPYKSTTMRAHLAKEHLYAEDLDRFDPKLGHAASEGRLLDVKNDLYRLPHLLIDRLAVLFGLRSVNTLDRAKELEKRGVIQREAARNLEELVAIGIQMRLQTYQFHQKQKGSINAVAHLFGFKEERGQYVLSAASFARLQSCTRSSYRYAGWWIGFFMETKRPFPARDSLTTLLLLWGRSAAVF